MAETFEAVVRKDGDIGVIEMHGELNGACDVDLADAVTEATSGTTNLLLDFSDIDYINSSGIALIVGILSKQWQESRRIYAFGLSDHFKEIFEITRLSGYIEIHDDERGAVSAARSEA
jgi:anti-anti-sigma factor